MAIQNDVQQLYDAALEIIESHNQNLADEVTDKTPGYVNPEAFLVSLKAAGGTSPDRLRGCSHEDILECMPVKYSPASNSVRPKALAKEIAKAFRGSSNTTSSDKPRLVSKKKADRMTIEELVANFDPEEPDSQVAERLDKLAKSQAFIVYQEGREVDVENTIKLLKEIRKLGTGRTIFDGKRVYCVGELPENYADENPLFPGRPLRPLDETCDQLNRSWAGVPLEVRQFVRFASEYEDGPSNRPIKEAHEVLSMALLPDAMEKFRERYPEIAVEFDEAKQRDELPKLSIVLDTIGALEASPVSPFDQGQKVKWERRDKGNYYSAMNRPHKKLSIRSLWLA